LRVALARGLDTLEKKVGPMNNTAATSTTIDVTDLVAEEEKRRFAVDQALGLEVYEFLYEAVAEECSRKRVLGGPRCGTCLVCKAKVLEEKLRIRHVKLGWKLDACKSCKGTGVNKVTK
jgi:hypothetical protein